MITILDTIPSLEQLLTLYDSVGWSAYTCEPDRLELAVTSSLSVFTALLSAPRHWKASTGNLSRSVPPCAAEGAAHRQH